MARRTSKPDAKKPAGGRPRLYESAEEFAAKVEAYFNSEEGKQFPTLSGLSVFMDFSDRESFSKYADYGDQFSRTVTRHACGSKRTGIARSSQRTHSRRVSSST